MEAVKLYYLRPSHYCEKARAILAYKGIPFEMVDVPYGDHTEVIAASGQDYVPYITGPGGKGVTWPDIPDWAEATKPEPTLYPGDAAVTRARSRLLDNWAHNVVEERVWRYVVGDVPPYLREGRERWVFVELQERSRGPLEVMAQRKPEFLVGVHEVLGLAEDLLGGKPYLLGDAPSHGDFALYGALHPLKFTGQSLPAGHDALQAWHDRVHAAAGGGAS